MPIILADIIQSEAPNIRQFLHRRAFVGEPHASSLSREELLRRIATHNESDGRLSERIKTVRSDVLYPWPAGPATAAPSFCNRGLY